jgi:ABC-2 type transport system ATP-binding protein
LRGLNKQQCTSAVSSVIYKTQLEAKASQTINTLSRGYRQRVGVAQAILSEPEILILDEPTNGLDPTQIQHMRELITNLGQSSTVIISTHILHEVQAICDRVLILRDAELALDAKLDELQNSRQLSLICNTEPAVLRDHIGGYPKLQTVDNPALDSGVFEYILACDDNENLSKLTPKLIKDLTQNNIDIYAIKPIQQDLEMVFRQINSIATDTTGDEAHAA